MTSHEARDSGANAKRSVSVDFTPPREAQRAKGGEKNRNDCRYFVKRVFKSPTVALLSRTTTLHLHVKGSSLWELLEMCEESFFTDALGGR